VFRKKAKRVMPNSDVPQFRTVYTYQSPLIRLATRRYLQRIESLLPPVDAGIQRVLDAGCGEGFVTRHIQALRPQWTLFPLDLDFQRAILVQQTSGAAVTRGSLYELPFPVDTFDLVLANEVLEHLLQPPLALQELRRVGRARLIASVPYEPVMILANLMRGAHLGRLGRTPSHVNFWTGPAFVQLLKSEGWSIERLTVCLPWILVAAHC
jgi:SAM-dependent methyltransferase